MKKISNAINIKKMQTKAAEYYERGVLGAYLTCKDKARLIHQEAK